MRRLAGLLCAAGMLLAACGDDGDGQARTVETTSTTTVPADTDASNDAGGGGLGDNGERDGTEPSAVSMSEVVVRLSDVPSGYSEVPPEQEGATDGSTDCAETDPFEDLDTIDEAESGFQRAELGPFVSSFAGRYEGAAPAEHAMEAITDFIESCDGITEVDDSGQETVYSVSALSFPALGDDTFAARVSVTSSFGPFTIDIVTSRVGDTIVSIFNGGLGGGDAELTEPLMRTMVDRL